jgi:biopolymer transport protein TolR
MPTPQRRRRLMGEINVVPYIDVMLVLLIIFMITAPLLKEGVKVDLPDAGAKPIDADFLAKHEPLILTIDSSGRLYINFGQNQDQPVSESTVSSRTAAIRRPRFWSRLIPPYLMGRWCGPWCCCRRRAPRRLVF